MNKIVKIKAREILDSRGNPTIEVDVMLKNNLMGRASVPSGASTGSNEALELRDNDTRYHGKGVLTAVYNVNNIIAPALIGQDVTNQVEIDKIMLELDGTTNKMQLGANAILAVSLACLKAAASLNNQALYEYVGTTYSMPYPMMNIINGGMHADSGLAFQEFMIIPTIATISERIRVGSEIFHTLKGLLSKAGFSTSVGDEGGFAPKLNSVEEALDLIVAAIKESGYKPGVDVTLALDVAATSFYKDGLYNLNHQQMTSDDLINYYVYLVSKYPIVSIEDGLAEDDWAGWKILTTKLGHIQLVGDDLFVTNKELLQKGINEKVANAILIKANQIGTVSEMLETINLAKANNYKTIISHRSGETEDTFIADLAVGLNLGQIKTGSLSRTDRVSKYNQLIRIEEKIKNI